MAETKLPCESHKEEQCISFCTQCDALVCLSCMHDPDHHQGHKCTSIKEVTNKRRSNAMQHRDELQRMMSYYSEANNELKENEKQIDKEEASLQHKIQCRAETLHMQIDNIKTELLTQLTEFIAIEKQLLGTEREKLENKLNKINILIAYIDDQERSKPTDQETFKAVLSFKLLLEPQNSSFLQKYPCFDPDGSSDEKKLKTLFGRLQLDEDNQIADSGDADKELSDVPNISEIRESTLNPYQESREEAPKRKRFYEIVDMETSNWFTEDNTSKQEIDPGYVDQRKKRYSFIKAKNIESGLARLHAGDNNTMWVTTSGSRDIRQFRKDGTEAKRLQTGFDVYDLTLNTRQELFVTESHGHYVRKFAKSMFSHKWTRFSYFPEPSITNGLCTTKEDEMFVCLQINPIGGRIVKISEQGIHLLNIEFDPCGKQLFDCPQFVEHNQINGDIYVKDSNSIIVVRNNNEPRYGWNGKMSTNFPEEQSKVYAERATPGGLTIDKNGNLFFSDFGNGKICTIDKEGKTMNELKDGIYQVTDIAFDTSGYMWIAGGGGLIFVEDFT